jgi:hypothetical protein
VNGIPEETANSCDLLKRPPVAVEHRLLAAEPPPPQPIRLYARSSLPQGSVRYCGITSNRPTIRQQRNCRHFCREIFADAKCVSRS